MITRVDNDSDIPYFDPMVHTPVEVRSANEIVDFWSDRALGRPLPTLERDPLVSFMAQGHNPDFDLPLGTDEDTQERLRTLIALILMTPSFLWR